MFNRILAYALMSLQFERYPLMNGENVTLASEEVHLWRASTDVRVNQLHKLRATLPLSDQVKSDRFFFERDRARFIASHAFLWQILSLYCGKEAQTFPLEFGSQGKPRLRGGPEFNLSHSENLVLLAIGGDQPVGVDVERVRFMPDAIDIAKLYFTKREYEALHRLSYKEQTETFFCYWTRKEACLKAVGYGLSLPLDSFEVLLSTHESTCIGTSRARMTPFIELSLHSILPSPGYIGALAVHGTFRQLRLWHMDLESVLGS